MGADFIGTFCKVTKTKDEAVAAFVEVPDNRLADLIDDLSIELDDETPRAFFAAQLETFYDDYVDGYDREVSMWRIDDVPYIVTGGMSWGDEPTDAYAVIVAVSELGVTC
jgi:hypothetical protein